VILPIATGALTSLAMKALRRTALASARRQLYRNIEARIAQRLSDKIRGLSRALWDATDGSAEHTLRIARELSSGPFSSRNLAMLGHPYRIGGRAPMDPAVINRQSGRFYRGWVIVGPRQEGGGIGARVINLVPYSRELFAGTRRMIARPTLVRIEQRTRERRRTLYKAAIRKALSR
jgi:hypothetical protein